MEPSFTIKYLLWLLTILVILQTYTSRCCLVQEKEALLQLKSYFMSLPFSSTESHKYLVQELSSWKGDNGENCCLWDRVQCNEDGSSIQHVTKISLSALYNHDQGNDIELRLNASLFQAFEELSRLDLSSNHLGRIEELAHLKKLHVLDLSDNSLSGSLPSTELAHLENLEELDFNYNGLNGSLLCKELTHLKNLRVLDLSYNTLSGSLTADCQGLYELKSLQVLWLQSNLLSGSLPDCLWSMTSLRVIDLSQNNFNGSFSPLINLPSLEYLSIQGNKFHGRFSLGSLMNHSKLEWLVLSNNALQVDIEEWPSTLKLKALGLAYCNVNGQYKTFPRFLYYHSHLKYIDLSSNGLVGSFPVWLLLNNTNLTYVNLRNNSLAGLMLPKHNNISLSYLDVSRNKFKGKVPNDIGMVLSSLAYLNMSQNAFDGHIPSSFGNMTQLDFLDLSENSFTGEVPRQLFSDCTSLKVLQLSRNNLQGDIIPSYMNLSSLVTLYLDNNNFGGTIKSSLNISSTYLWSLDISNNNGRGKLPSWMGDLQGLSWMSLARNQFQGDIPIQLCKLRQLRTLHLSENQFSGQIPSCDKLSNLLYLHMEGNNLSGAIPKGLAGMSSLVALDLRNNDLLGGLPQWIDKLSYLAVLRLGDNQLEGKLPIQLCRLKYLNILDLSSNRISGTIPSCLRNLPFGAKPLSVSYLIGDMETFFPDSADEDWEEEGMISQIIRQEKVELRVKGRYYSYISNTFSSISSLDLSCNKLIGGIPPELEDLTSLFALNLSHNGLFGSIPTSFSKLKAIESLDLSRNNLSGTIPSELVDLTFLEKFNVPYNNLSGQVPQTAQFGTFDETSYIGNPLLCGSTLPRACGIDDKVSPMSHEEEFDKEAFLWSFGMCYVIVLLTWVVVLTVNPHWRRAWFAFIHAKFLWWFNP